MSLISEEKFTVLKATVKLNAAQAMQSDIVTLAATDEPLTSELDDGTGDPCRGTCEGTCLTTCVEECASGCGEHCNGNCSTECGGFICDQGCNNMCQFCRGDCGGAVT